VKNHPILIKFGTLQHILNPMKSRDQKLKFLKFKMAAAAMYKNYKFLKSKMADGRHFENR